MISQPSSTRADENPSNPWFRTALPLTGLMVVGLSAAAILEPSPTLSAEEHARDGDVDNDGLDDEQELVLQSSPFKADTDGDGFGDAEELARGSSAFSAGNVPLPGEIDLGMTARGEDGDLRIAVAAYFTDGTATNKSLHFGILLGEETIIEVDPSQLMHGARSSVSPTMSGSGHVMVVDFAMPSHLIYQIGQLSLFATLSVDGQGYVAAASVIDFFVTPSGVLVHSGEAHGPVQDAARQGPSGSGGGSGFHQPIPPGGDLPMGWVPGSICRQTTEPIGYNNGIMITRVNDAECVDGWDSSCNATECKASVGDEYATIDPVGLVGG